ncbi:MAG TPA: plastocyanin/azurin family copper-binding protein [Thermomicrobiales bacterium]|nr:plastocyanin/azurin family copper-binding protein [Thermomicrobiales bacterium]
MRTGGMAAIGLIAVPLAGCGEDGNTVHTVTMTNGLIFEPSVLRIKVGERVRWRNTGIVVHSVTTDPEVAQDSTLVLVPGGTEPWDSGLIQAGDTWERAFDMVGEYRYLCMPHEMAGMTGIIIVEA